MLDDKPLPLFTADHLRLIVMRWDSQFSDSFGLPRGSPRFPGFSMDRYAALAASRFVVHRDLTSFVTLTSSISSGIRGPVPKNVAAIPLRIMVSAAAPSPRTSSSPVNSRRDG